MKLSTVLRFSFMALCTSKAYSATDANVAVDGAFTSEAEAAGFKAENPGLVTALADMVAAATFHPLLRGSFGEKDPVNLAIGNVGQVPLDIEIVECIDGKTPSGETCEVACNNGIDCCGPLGTGACDRFTGKVAKDGSCMGEQACYQVGYNGGSVGLISGASCVGSKACNAAGWRGIVKSISGASCVGHRACGNVGASGGSVRSISGASCIAKQACSAVGAHGTIGDLTGCCTTENECLFDRNIADLPATCTHPATPNPTPVPTPESCVSQSCNAWTSCCPYHYCSSQSTCKAKKGTGERCALRKECISGKCAWPSMKCK